MASGDLGKAVEALHEAAVLWRELGNLPMLTDTLSNFSIHYFVLADFEKSLQSSDEAVKISESIGNVWGEAYGRFIVSYVLAERGEWGQALRSSEKCLGLADQAGFVPPQCIVQAQMAFIYAEAGAFEQAFIRGRAAVEVAERLYPVWQAFAHAMLARCRLAASEVDAAQVLIDQAIRELKTTDPLSGMTTPSIRVNQAWVSLASGDNDGAIAACESLRHYRRGGVRSYLTDELLIRGLASLAIGDDASAKPQLEAAVAEAREIGCRRTLWKVLLALSQLEARSDHAEKAEELRGQAAEEVSFIAAHIDDEDVRRSFLGKSEVRKVLGGG
jgi:tetratricopeptide (TPR) repeat protein